MTFSDITNKINKSVSAVAGVTLGVALTFTALVQIKSCLGKLLPKKRNKVVVKVFSFINNDDVETKSDTKTEADVEAESDDDEND